MLCKDFYIELESLCFFTGGEKKKELSLGDFGNKKYHRTQPPNNMSMEKWTTSTLKFTHIVKGFC